MSPHETTMEVDEPTFPILELPVDILHVLTGHMSPESTHLLSLTCRALRETLARPKLDRSSKLALLCQLEKESAGQQVCHSCLKLHPVGKLPLGPPGSIFDLGGNCQWAYTWVPGTIEMGLAFSDVWAAIRRETFHGATWDLGMSMDKLNRHHKYHISDLGHEATEKGLYPVSSTRETKLSKNTFLIHQRHHFRHSKTLPPQELASLFESVSFNLCTHTHLPGDAILEAAQGCAMPRRCTGCAMSFEVIYTEEEVLVDSWHNMGDVTEGPGYEWKRAIAFRRRSAAGGKENGGVIEEGSSVKDLWEA